MADNQAKLDRRKQRTLRLLREALMELVVEKGYDNLTIQDITDRADVARTTFYLHFRDKDDLLFQSMEALYDELVASFPYPLPDALRHSPSEVGKDATDFRHVAEHAAFYKAMLLRDQGSIGFLNRVRHYLSLTMLNLAVAPAAGQPPCLPPDFISAALAGLEIGVISWWLENNMPYTPEQMAEMVYQFCAPALFAALAPDAKQE